MDLVRLKRKKESIPLCPRISSAESLGQQRHLHHLSHGHRVPSQPTHERGSAIHRRSAGPHLYPPKLQFYSSTSTCRCFARYKSGGSVAIIIAEACAYLGWYFVPSSSHCCPLLTWRVVSPKRGGGVLRSSLLYADKIISLISMNMKNSGNDNSTGTPPH